HSHHPIHFTSLLFIIPPQPSSTLFPYTTLFRSSGIPGEARLVRHHGRHPSRRDHFPRAGELDPGWTATAPGGTLRSGVARTREVDRKSTRLNSSHVKISYAVFCLKKKKK